MTTEPKPGPFAADSLCNFRRIGSRWMLDFRTQNIGDQGRTGKHVLVDVETVDSLQENPSGHVLVFIRAPIRQGTHERRDEPRVLIAAHPWSLISDRYESCMWAAEKWRHEQELRAEDTDSIDAQLRRVNRNWMDLDKGPSDSSLEQIVEEAERMLGAAQSSLQASKAKAKSKTAKKG